MRQAYLLGWGISSNCIALAEHVRGIRIDVRILQFGASLGAQLVKNLPTMWEAWVRSLG